MTHAAPALLPKSLPPHNDTSHLSPSALSVSTLVPGSSCNDQAIASMNATTTQVLNPATNALLNNASAPPMYSSPDDKDRFRDRHTFAAAKYHQHPKSRACIRFSDPEYHFFNMHSGHIILFARRQWSSAEHLYQSLKFDDPRIRRKIRHAQTPMEARELAAKYAPLMKPRWPELRLDYARAVVALKTAQHPDISFALLATGDDALLNDSSHPFWGMPPAGQNQLGRIWVEERARLSLEIRLKRPNLVNLMVSTRKDLEE